MPIRFLMSICLSICMYHRISHWTYFCEIWYCGLLRISINKIQIWPKLDKKCHGILLKDLGTFYFCWRHKFAAKSFFFATLIFLYCWEWHVAQQYSVAHCSIATMIMGRSITLYVCYLPCYSFELCSQTGVEVCFNLKKKTLRKGLGFLQLSYRQ